MRLSIFPDAFGGDARLQELLIANPGKFPAVFLNDREVEGCTLADEERGFLIKYRRSRDGGAYFDFTRGEAVLQRRAGRVRIELR